MELIKILSLLLPLLQLHEAFTGCKNFLHNRCFFIDQDGGRVNYSAALKNCELHGGTLAIVNDSETNTFLINMIKREIRILDSKFWIGLTFSSGYWFYSDGNHISSYSNWAQRRFFYDDQSCAIMDETTGKWQMRNCAFDFYAICQLHHKFQCQLSEIQISNSQFDKCNEEELVDLGTKIKISCNRGFLLEGPEEISCTSVGWSELPKCFRICLLPDLPNTMKIFNPKPRYEVGDKVIIYCVKGFLLGTEDFRSHQIVECNEDGNWPSLKKSCVSLQESKCPNHFCSETNIKSELDSPVTLDCPFIDKVKNITYYYIRWYKDHELLKLPNVSTYVIPYFQENNAGTYTCLRSHIFSSVSNIVIFRVKVARNCPVSPLVNVSLIEITEGQSIYLQSVGAGSILEVDWFKDGKKLVATSERFILSNGDLLIRTANINDQGVYKFDVTGENSSCTNSQMTNVVVHSKVENICGQIDDKNNHPWVIFLKSLEESSPFCYGALINEYWVITSAFCLSKFNRLKNINVVVRFQQNLTKDNPVEQIYLHPEFSERLGVNDIGLIKLQEKVIFSKKIKPICLFPKNYQQEINHCDKQKELPFTSGLVAGWGSIEKLMPGNIGAIELENLKFVGKNLCQKFVSFEFPDKMFCAALEENSVSARAVGDYGSPFVVKIRDRVYLYGIYSWGERISKIGDFDFFTKLSSYYTWIDSIIKSN